MDPRIIDLTGKTFGFWKVLRYAGSRAAPSGGATWLCRCICGTKRAIGTQVLRNILSQSCGCKKGELIAKKRTRHGHGKGYTHSPEYRAWAAMKNRCYNQSTRDYSRWGAKGIGVYAPWRKRKGFPAFLAYLGPRPGPGYTLGRIDHTKDYKPGNVRWITRRENSSERNKGYRPVGWNPPHRGPKTHGMSKTRTYCSWAHRKQRGLFSGRWKKFKAFLKDMGVRPVDTDLARIDPNKSYQAGNCYWALKKDRHRRRLI